MWAESKLIMALTSVSPHSTEVEDERIAAFCERNHIARLGLLGTLLRGDAESSGDIDVIVEFEPGHSPGYIGLAGMEIELTAALGREAHLYTVSGLGRSLGDATLSGAVEWRYDTT